jgi:hypothetical protein
MADNNIINTDNALTAARFGIGFIPGAKQAKLATELAKGTAEVGLGFVQGNNASVVSDEEYTRLSGLLENDLKREAKYSRSLKGALNKVKDHHNKRPWVTAASALGGVAGGLLMTFVVFPLIFTGPPGWIVGGLLSMAGITAGAFVADTITSFALPRKIETPVEVISQMRAQQQNGQGTSPEAVFVALAGSLRHEEKEKIREDLYKLTGKRSMKAALESGNFEALQKLMRKYDGSIRADTGAIPDMSNPGLTASEQYAAAVNNGLDARLLLFRDGRLPMDLSETDNTVNTSLPSPSTPGMGRGGPAFGK